MSQFNNNPRIGYMDRFMSDGAVERSYSNGLRERRVLQAQGTIAWSDTSGQQGVDIYLGNAHIRRETNRGQTSIGLDLGNGITSWNGGAYVTVNETPFPDPPIPAPVRPRGLGGLMLGLGLGWMFGINAYQNSPFGLDPATPEYALYAEYDMMQEEALRRQQLSSDTTGGGDSGGDSGDSYSSNDTGADFDGSDSGGGDFGSDSFG